MHEAFRRITAYAGGSKKRNTALLDCMAVSNTISDVVDGGFLGLLNILEFLEEKPATFYQIYDNQCDCSAVKCYVYYRARHLGYFPDTENFGKYAKGQKDADFDSLLTHMSRLLPQLEGETIQTLEQKHAETKR